MMSSNGHNSWSQHCTMSAVSRPRSEFANPIMRQAEELVQRTMMLQSPEDPDVTNLIQDDADAQLALFLSKTLTNAIMMYRQGGPSPGAGPIGPPGHNKPGPIGPPRGKIGSGRVGGRQGQDRGQGRQQTDFSEFYADTSMGPRSGGLYGLSEPLFQLQGGGGGQGFGSGMEPPYKRKYEDW